MDIAPIQRSTAGWRAHGYPGLAVDHRHHHPVRLTRRYRRSDLPGRIRPRHLDQPHDPDQYQQPGRRAIDHLRHAGAGGLCARILDLTSGAMFGIADADPENGRTILSAGLTLALLILPVIIINAQEAIRAVPNSSARSQLWVGRDEMANDLAPRPAKLAGGIMTGTILSISRAFGETAPLVVIGASTYITFDPQNIFSKFTALPIQIYQWTARPQAEFRNLAAAAILVLLILLLSINAIAIILTQPLQPEACMSYHQPAQIASKTLYYNLTASLAIEARNLNVYLWQLPGGQKRQPVHRQAKDHCHHRTFGLRQEHHAALLQPHERAGAQRPHRRGSIVPRAKHLPARRLIRWKCAAISAWYFKSQTLSRRASMRISPGARRSMALKAAKLIWRPG